MSDLVEKSSFDMEAQETLLLEIHKPAINPAAFQIETAPFSSLSSTWQKLRLLIRSGRFKLMGAGASYHNKLFNSTVNYSSSSISSKASEYSFYSAINGADDNDAEEITSDIQLFIADHQDNAQMVATPEDHSDEETISSNVHNSTRSSKDEYKKNIAEIVKLKNLEKLKSLGGVTGVARELKTDLENGIIKMSNTHHYVEQITPSSQQHGRVSVFFHCLQRSWNNYTIILLCVAAVLSLIFGIKQQGLVPAGWFNGTIVFITIFLLVIFKTIRHYYREMSYHHKKLETHNKLKAKVIRNGNQVIVSAIDLEIGDLVVLERGCVIPADGLIYLAAGEHLEVEGYSEGDSVMNEANPFLFYESRVTSGNAKMLVISVGVDTVWGEILSQTIIRSSQRSCKFEAFLNNVNNFIQTVGILIVILINIALFVRYVFSKTSNGNGSNTDPKGEGTRVNTIIEAIKGIIISGGGSKSGTTRVLTLLSISLIGVTEGLPVVISFVIFLWNRKMLAPHKAIDRDYTACVKMASITSIICTDKLGGLTEHEQKIDTLLLVGEEFFSESSQVASNVLNGICEGIEILNSMPPPIGWNSEFVNVMVSWAQAKIGLRMRGECKISKRVTGNNPLTECCRVVMEKSIGIDGRNKQLYLYYNGPPREILSFCSHYYNLEGEMHRINYPKLFEYAIGQKLADQQQVISIACKSITNESDVEANHGFILLGMIGLKCRKSEETKRSILALKEGGIRIILATGDDVSVLEAIGQNCGILSESSSSDDLVLTADQYRRWSNEEKNDRIGKISIIGNCNLSDKNDLLKLLKEKGKKVAVLGQRTIDAPLLKEADIGLTSGSWTSEVAREISDIHVQDGDFFCFLVNVINKGRCFRENISRDFIQIQIIISISSSLINFIASVSWGDAPLTAIQLLWLNLTVALVGGLIVLTGPTVPTSSSSDSEQLLMKKAMRWNIAIQASYQTIVLVILQSKGQAILGICEANVKFLIYEGFCLCQFFCMIIAREPKAMNIFTGLQKNGMYFCVAMLVFLLFHGAFVAAETFLVGTPWMMTWKLLGVYLVIGVGSWFLDFAKKWVSPRP